MRDHVRHAGGGRVAAATDVLLLGQLQNVVDALTPANALGMIKTPSTGMMAAMKQALGDLLPRDPSKAALWTIPP
jgi:subfamily B ATP-binding cassette protein MsbA